MAGNIIRAEARYNGILCLIMYYSKKHIPTENNYKIHDKELLVIIRYLKVWDTELRNVSKGFNIITDYKNIKYFIKK